MESQISTLGTALVYSCIAFSIVFIVLGGLTVVIYAMRIVTGSEARQKPSSGESVAVQPKIQPEGVNTQHVAAIAAAIAAATQGRGKVVNVALAPQQQRTFSSETTQIWRTVAVVEASSRRLVPSWKH
ncbi:MAG: OadG family protein [Synergistaceae bacterium]|jgi:Na+-transporting methylmalonyl-CoA/oxaloacetate decarboxylase gamma subunit|nr:OadG family protein [Synergistaceae bacterium]